MLLRTRFLALLAILLLTAPGLAADAAPKTDRYGDPLPSGALARLGTVRWRHGGGASFVAFLGDGKQLLTAGDNTYRIWDRATGREVRTIRVPQPALPLLAPNEKPSPLQIGSPCFGLSSDGKILATWLREDVIRLWDVASGKQRDPIKGLTAGLIELAFTPDGKTLAAMEISGTIRLLDVVKSREIRHFGQPREEKRLVVQGQLVFSPDGRRLATLGNGLGAGFDRSSSPATVRVWDAANGKELHAVRVGRRGLVSCMAFSPDGKVLACAESPGLIYLINAENGKEVSRLKDDATSLTGLIFAADGKTLFVCADQTIRVWDLETATELRRLGQPAATPSRLTFSFFRVGLPPGGMALSPDGKVLALVGGSEPVRLLDAVTGKNLALSGGHQAALTSVGYSPDGKTVISWSQDDTSRRWQALTGRETGRVLIPLGGGQSPALSDDGRLLATVEDWGQMTLFDTATGQAVRTIEERRWSGSNTLTLSPNGRLLAVRDGLRDWALKLYDTQSGKQVCSLGEEEKGAAARFRRSLSSPALAFSADGRLLAAGGPEGSFIICETAAGKEVCRLAVPDGQQVRSVALSPDGRSLALKTGH